MTKSRLRRILVMVAPVAAAVAILVVLHGAGIPLTVPGVIVVVLLLIVGRVVVAVSRRRRAGRPEPAHPRLTRRSRSR